MLEFKDMITVGSVLAAVAGSWAAMKVGFSKDVSALQESDKRIRARVGKLENDMESGFTKLNARLAKSVQELKDRAPMDAAESSAQFTKVNGMIQSISLEVQSLKIKEAQQEERRRHHTNMLEQTNDLLRRQSEKSDRFQNEMIQQLSKLSTKLDERTKNQHT